MKDFNDMISKNDKTLADVKKTIEDQLVPAQKTECIEKANTSSKSKFLTADMLLENQEKRLAKYKGKELIGLPQKTLPQLDKYLLGFRKFTLLSAAPNVGKTALTIQLGIDLIKNNPEACLLFISIEMTREDIFDRIRCYLTPMSYKKLYFGSIKDGEDKEWYTKEELEALELSKKTIETIGNRILILDDDCDPDINTENIIEHVDSLKKISGCKKAIVIIDYLQVLQIPENIESKLHSDNACDRYRIKKMKKLRMDLNNDPLIVISESRKPPMQIQKVKWKTSKADVMGSSRSSYGADCLLFLNEFSNNELIDKLEKEKKTVDKDLDIHGLLAKKGISILSLDSGKGRDGMTKGSILVAYHFQENRFEETTYENIYTKINEILKDFPNITNQTPKKKKHSTQKQQCIAEATQKTSYAGRLSNE